MPGFPSSFEAPDERTIERYLKFKRMADPSSGAMPNEMASARREMEKLDAQYPSLRALGAAGPAAGAPPPPPGASVFDWLKNVDQFVKNVSGALGARTLALQTAELNWRTLSDNRLRLTVTLPVSTLESVVDMHEVDRRQFATAVGEMLVNQLLAAVQEIDENG